MRDADGKEGGIANLQLTEDKSTSFNMKDSCVGECFENKAQLQRETLI